jgi:hypothetical protein
MRGLIVDCARERKAMKRGGELAVARLLQGSSQ